MSRPAGLCMQRYESRRQRVSRQIEERRLAEVKGLKKKIDDQILEVGLYQNMCFDQRVLLQEILAVCRQEHLECLELGEKLERIESYARRAMVTKR